MVVLLVQTKIKKQKIHNAERKERSRDAEIVCKKKHNQFYVFSLLLCSSAPLLLCTSAPLHLCTSAPLR
jgi:Na+-transporting methylmalonyl-CoA/oxaloacetate decarboxylase beta subunit